MAAGWSVEIVCCVVQGARLSQNLTARVVVSNRALVLQRVGPHSTGTYTCTASNIEGDTASQPAELAVQFRPRCLHPGPLTVAVTRTPHSTVIPCDASALPAPHRYQWEVNRTGGRVEQISLPGPALPLARLHHLQLPRRPARQLGQAACWPENSIGRAEQPCLFQLVTAGKTQFLRQEIAKNLNPSETFFV